MIPVWERMMTISASLIVVMSYSLIIFTGINITDRKINKLWLIIIGTFTLICVWIEFALGWSEMISMIRIISTLILFISLFYSLIIEIISTKDICVEMILAVMSGFLFLGILGGVVFELNDTLYPNSFNLSADTGNYSYYYFSFINLTSIGFGDIYPQTAATQSITLILGIIGQFYMAFGVTVFIGKFLNQQQISKNS